MKFSVFWFTLAYLIFHLKQNQYFPSVAVVFGANIITVHSCVHACVCSVCSQNTRRAWEWSYVHGLSSFLTSLYAYVLFMNVKNEQKWWECLFLASEIQVRHSNYSWNVLSSPLTHWPLKRLTWFYFTIIHLHSQSTFKTKYHCILPPTFIRTLQAQIGEEH